MSAMKPHDTTTLPACPERALRCYRAGLGLALAAVLAACGPSESPTETPAAEPPAPTTTAPLPATRLLEVHVEGQREAREARLFQGPNGYAIYVLPQLEMTQEEPCCDLAYARVDPDFFLRIERIGEAPAVDALAADMDLALSSVGPAEAADVQGYFPAEARAEVELARRAVGDGVSLTMLVVRIDGGRYRVTLHLPHREALEGIAPSLWAMLGSLRTTGPGRS